MNLLTDNKIWYFILSIYKRDLIDLKDINIILFHDIVDNKIPENTILLCLYIEKLSNIKSNNMEFIIKTLNHKSNFVNYLKNMNFDIYIPTIYDQKTLDKNSFPIIIKDNVGIAGIGTEIFKNYEEYLPKFYNKNINDRIIQKYILSDMEYSGHYLCKNGKIIHSIIFEQKTKKYEIKRGSFTNYIISNKLKDIHIFQQILEKINYNGFCCFDYVYEIDTDNLKIFEMNPRIGGTLMKNKKYFFEFIEKASINKIFLNPT
jgi:carbamoylphosphate synthase large subunit